MSVDINIATIKNICVRDYLLENGIVHSKSYKENNKNQQICSVLSCNL